MKFKTNEEALAAYSKNTERSSVLIADADTGWRKNVGNNRIDVHVGTFKPGTLNDFKFRFEGQLLNIDKAHPTCPCTTGLTVRKNTHADFGNYHVVSGKLSILDLESLTNTDENVRKGAKIVARQVAVDILYQETERDAFIESEEGDWFSNPMAFWTRVNIMYNIDLN